MVEVKLAKPVFDPLKDRFLEVLTLKEPTVRELRLADEAAKKRGEVELGRQLLAQCSGVDPSVLDKLSLADFNRASAALAALVNGSDEEGAGVTAAGFSSAAPTSGT